MKENLCTAKLKLVTVILPDELSEDFVTELKLLGVLRYSSSRLDGYGRHGPRHAGFAVLGNVRLEALVDAETSASILRMVTDKHVGAPVVAFSADVEAVPSEAFAK